MRPSDTSGYAAKYTGSWATASDIDSTRSIDTISCESSTFCVAAGASGYAATYTGSWATATDADSTRTIKAVLCPSSTLCVAVDSSGYATTYNASTWATPTDVDGSNALEALSCASTTFCVAVDADGNALTYNGTSWGTATDVDAARSVSAISCPASTFCATGDGSGYAALYAPVPATSVVSQLTWNTNGSLALVLSDGAYDYVYGPNATPVEEVGLRNSTPTFMTFDPSDSAWFTTNAAGDETGFYGYDAYGNLAFGMATSAFGYAGQYSDATTGFLYMRARFYDAQIGEFTTRDPDFQVTNDAFEYAGDDPVSGDDPSGLHNCNFNPFTWGGCVENGVEDAESFALDPIKGKAQQLINGIEAAQSSESIEAAADFECADRPNSESTSSPYRVLASIANRFRLPDYVSIEASGGDFGVVGGAVFTVTRYGSIFLGPEIGVGVPGFLLDAEAGWIDQPGIPGRNQLNTFVSANSITFEVFAPIVFDVAGPTVAEIYGNVGESGWSAFGTQVGFGGGNQKNASLQWSYSFHISDSGPTW